MGKGCVGGIVWVEDNNNSVAIMSLFKTSSLIKFFAYVNVVEFVSAILSGLILFIKLRFKYSYSQGFHVSCK